MGQTTPHSLARPATVHPEPTMKAPHDAAPQTPAPISRRESLRRTAGALALGLGMPASVLAGSDGDAEGRDVRIAFYRGDDRRPFHAAELPDEVAEVLFDDRARVFAKVTVYQSERERRPREASFRLDRVE